MKLALVLLAGCSVSTSNLSARPTLVDPIENQRPLRAARTVNLALSAGVGTWFALESFGYTPAKNELDASAYTRDEQKLNKTLGVAAPVLMASMLVSDLPLLWLHRHDPSSPKFLS